MCNTAGKQWRGKRFGVAPIVVAGAKRGVKQREGMAGWPLRQAQVQKQRIETGQMWTTVCR